MSWLAGTDTDWEDAAIGLLVNVIRESPTSVEVVPSTATEPAFIRFERSLTIPNLAMPFTANLGAVFAAMDVCPTVDAASTCETLGDSDPTGCATAAIVVLEVEDSPGLLSHFFTGSATFVFPASQTMCVSRTAADRCVMHPVRALSYTRMYAQARRCGGDHLTLCAQPVVFSRISDGAVKLDHRSPVGPSQVGALLRPWHLCSCCCELFIAMVVVLFLFQSLLFWGSSGASTTAFRFPSSRHSPVLRLRRVVGFHCSSLCSCRATPPNPHRPASWCTCPTPCPCRWL